MENNIQSSVSLPPLLTGSSDGSSVIPTKTETDVNSSLMKLINDSDAHVIGSDIVEEANSSSSELDRPLSSESPVNASIELDEGTPEDASHHLRQFFHVPYVDDVEEMKLKEIIAVWAVIYKIPRLYVTELLKLLKKWKCSVDDLVDLPATSATLLKVKRDDPIIRKIVKKVKKSTKRRSKAAPKSNPNPQRSALKHLGHYIHFRLLVTLLKNSAGE